jgi:hypothetical protein
MAKYIRHHRAHYLNNFLLLLLLRHLLLTEYKLLYYYHQGSPVLLQEYKIMVLGWGIQSQLRHSMKLV